MQRLGSTGGQRGALPAAFDRGAKQHRSDAEKQYGAECQLNHVLHRGSVPETPEEDNTEERSRHRAEGEPADERPADRALADVNRGPDGLHDQRGDQVARHRRQRLHTEEKNQNRSHQRAAAHAGETNRHADDEPGQGDVAVDVHPEPPLCRRGCLPRGSLGRDLSIGQVA